MSFLERWVRVEYYAKLAKEATEFSRPGHGQDPKIDRTVRAKNQKFTDS